MNHIYFACCSCRVYIDAGYRWAAHLPASVYDDAPLNVEAVMRAENYWRGVEEADWLRELLPKIRQFLEAHRQHDLVFGQEEKFLSRDEPSSLFWTEIEDIDPTDDEANAQISFFWSPVVFVEVFNYRTWEEVGSYLTKTPYETWWFCDSQLRYEARRVFEYLVQRKAQSS